jgi:SAM-dependent methyltransferase
MDLSAPPPAATATPPTAAPDAMLHRLPAARVVDRVAYLLEQARGRRVVHLGFVDAGLMQRRREHGAWLHARLAGSARELVGVDLDEAGVELARAAGYQALAADCQSGAALRALGLAPADLVVAGELLEHLDCPGRFLEAVKPLLAPGGALLLTTPNATALGNFLAALRHHEAVNPDHVSWYSWRTLVTLLGRHGWVVRDFCYYAYEDAAPPAARGLPPAARLRRRGAAAVRAATRSLLPRWPSLADGLVVRCTSG